MQDSISPQIAEIRARYQTSLPEKAAMIQEHILLLSADSITDEKIKETHETLHKLAGSAGMYGYDDVSLLSRAAMNHTSKEQLSTLLSQLDELKTLLESHS